MANISAYQEKNFLDWCFKGAAATQPANVWVGLAVGTPTLTGASEMGTLTGYSRVTGLFGAAASPAGSVSNTASMVFGTFSSNGSVLGLQVWDGSPVGSSNMLWYGTLQAARTIQPGDTLIIAVGALTATLS